MDPPSTLSRTITAPPPTTRRPSNFIFTENKPSPSQQKQQQPPPPPLLSHSQSINVPFSSLSLQSPTTPTTKYTSHRTHPLAEQHHPFFSPSQLAGIRPLCSLTEIDDLAFLTLEKYPTLHSAQSAYDLEMTTLGLSIDLAANNPKTHNFNKLILHLLELLKDLQSNQYESIPIEVFNALFLTQAFMKQFAANLTNQEIVYQLEDDINKTTYGEMLMESLLYTMINMDPCFNHSTYEFYTEVLNTLIVFCSTQLHQSKLSQANNYFLNILMSKFANRAETIVARLLENMIGQKTAPPQSSSVMYTAYNYFFSGRASTSTLDPEAIPVADRSLLLLLLLGTQPESDLNQAWIKAYRFALANLSDHHVISSDLDGQDRRMHLISFKDLLDIFSASIHVEERMILFYLILKENESFRVFVLSRTDQETIYLPILKLIYESMEAKANYAQLYMLFLILLILSEDDVNNEALHKVTVNQIPWLTERPLLKSISLGGLVILVLIRALQLNLSHHRDIYLHTNALAILSNMSSTILEMHAYVAQRLISFFEVLARRYSKSTETTDGSVYEDLLVLLLEVIHTALRYRLKHNAQLVYALLQKKEIFMPFRSHPRFVDLVHNLEEVIQHFNTRVFEANLKAPSSSEVLQLIEQASRTWSNQQWIVLPQLKFQYREDPSSFEFFIPYIWALIYRKSFFYWSDEKCHALENYHRLNEEE